MENSVSTESQPQFSPQVRLLIGLVAGIILLIPLAIVLERVQLTPALNTYDLSQTDSNLLREPRDVEQENYERMLEDPRLTDVIAFSQEMMRGRILAVAFIPVIVGLLIGIQGLAGRVLNRVVLGLLTVITGPVAVIVLWRAYWSPLWGREPSPVYPPPDDIFLGSREGAPNALLQLDSTLTLAIALIALVAIYAAVVRGWRRGRLWSALQAGAGVWVISLGLAAFSGFFQVFTLPYYLTQGGPANATNTYTLYMYQNGFQALRIGYATAFASYMIGGALVLAFLVWLVTVVFRLRLSFTPPARIHRLSSVVAVVTIPALLLLLYPIINLLLWGSGQAAASDFNLRDLPVPWPVAQNNTLTSLGAIWLILLPTTYMAGLGLGFVRPLGRIVSNILFLPLLLLAFIPTEALMFAWFMDGRDMNMINTPDLLNVPWLVSGLALLIFKLFFDGAHERYMRARQQQAVSPTTAFLHQVLLPSLLVVLLVGVVASFASTQDLLWPLVAVNDMGLRNIPVTLALLIGMFGTDNSMAVSTVMTFFNILLWFVVPFVLLQVFVLDRLALLGGKTDYSVYDVPESSETAPVIDLGS